jgi:hypothetical protein
MSEGATEKAAEKPQPHAEQGRRELMRRGIDRERARISASNGHGPWWNAGASHMNLAVPTRYLTQLGLPSLLQLQRRRQSQARTAVYGTVRTVV